MCYPHACLHFLNTGTSQLGFSVKNRQKKKREKSEVRRLFIRLGKPIQKLRFTEVTFLILISKMALIYTDNAFFRN